MKKPTSKQTRLFQAKIFPHNGATGQIEQSSHGKKGGKVSYADQKADGTHGHINSTGCEQMATTVTAAHHSIWRHLFVSVHAAKNPKKQARVCHA